MPTVTFNDIYDTISSGAVDEQLDAINAAIKDRRDVISRRLFHSVKPGQRGHLKNLRPKYLVGAPVTVIKRNETRIVVQIDDDYAERHHITGGYRGEVSVTPDMLDLVPADG